MFAALSLMAVTVFSFNVYSLGLVNLALFFLNLVFFAWSVGLAILGVIFRLGTRIQALAWGLVFLFQPLTGVYYPINVLPEALQTVARLVPATYVFEAARNSLESPAIQWQAMSIALLENAIYFGLAVAFFSGS